MKIICQQNGQPRENGKIPKNIKPIKAESKKYKIWTDQLLVRRLNQSTTPSPPKSHQTHSPVNFMKHLKKS